MTRGSDLIQEVATALGAATGRAFTPVRQTSATGGCINRSSILMGQDDRRYFLKTNRAELADMFAAEADGLAALDRSGAIRVPRPLAWGVTGPTAWLALEFLPLGGASRAADLGHRLARLHRTTQDHFGWHRDNVLGATHQPNLPGNDWIAFYRVHRLGHQLTLARDNGASRHLLRMGEQLQDHLAGFFPGYTPGPSLLHGDLWGGNYGYVEGEPVLFDPAVYCGDREADLAMTELFGGFPAEFYAAYRESWPLDEGYRTRRVLYNLYHVLNHFNLFGGGYGHQAEQMAEGLLAEIR